jgi:hypothetical protein
MSFNDTVNHQDYIALVIDEPVWSTDGKILMQKTQSLKKHPSQCYFVHDKYHMEWPGTERWPAW